MSVTFNERQAIQEYIKYIQEERTRLTVNYNNQMDKLLEEYKEAMSRLSKLDDIEGRPTQRWEPALTLKIPTPPSTVEEEVQYEEEDNQMVTPTSNVDKESSLLEQLRGKPVEEVIAIFNEHQQSKPIIEDDEEDTTSTQEEVNEDDSKVKPPLDRRYGTATRRDIKTITKEVAHILKEKGTPMKVKEIAKKLEEKGIDVKDLYSTIHQVKAYEPRIQKASHGYLQYKY